MLTLLRRKRFTFSKDEVMIASNTNRKNCVAVQFHLPPKCAIRLPHHVCALELNWHVFATKVVTIHARVTRVDQILVDLNIL